MFFTSGSLSLWMPGLKILANLYLFSLARFRAFNDAAHSRLWCKDPKLCLWVFLKMLVLDPHQIYTNVFLLVEVYRFGQCLRWRFSSISTFFSLVSSRAFIDAPHSRFRCGDPNQFFTCGSLSIWTMLG